MLLLKNLCYLAPDGSNNFCLILKLVTILSILGLVIGFRSLYDIFEVAQKPFLDDCLNHGNHVIRFNVLHIQSDSLQY